MPKVPQKLKILKKNCINSKFKNTSFLFYKCWQLTVDLRRGSTRWKVQAAHFYWSTSTVDRRQRPASNLIFSAVFINSETFGSLIQAFSTLALLSCILTSFLLPKHLRAGQNTFLGSFQTFFANFRFCRKRCDTLLHSFGKSGEIPPSFQLPSPTCVLSSALLVYHYNIQLQITCQIQESISEGTLSEYLFSQS